MEYKDFIIIILIFLGFFSLVYLRLHLVIRKGKKYRYHADDIDKSKINKNLSDLIKLEPSFSESEIVNKAYSLYEGFQYAWSNEDTTSFKNVLTDELVNNYSLQLKGNDKLHVKNVIKDIELLNGKFEGFDIKKNKLNIYVSLKVKLIDYMYDEVDKEILFGEETPTTYTYDLVISKDNNSNNDISSLVISKIRNHIQD